MYWNVLLPGRPLPLPAQMSHGRQRPRSDLDRHAETGDLRCPSTTIDGHSVHVDDEGFLTDYDEWTEDLASVARRARSASS